MPFMGNTLILRLKYGKINAKQGLLKFLIHWRRIGLLRDEPLFFISFIEILSYGIQHQTPRPLQRTKVE